MECLPNNMMPMIVLLLLMLICDCQKQVFYIRPSDSSHCPQEVNASQCYDLSTFVSEGHLSLVPNTSLLFHSGEHFLEQNLDVKNSIEFEMIAYHAGKGIRSESSVRITCTDHNRGGQSVRIQNVSFVKINSISFQSCGFDVDSSGVLQLRSVAHSEIINSKWYESRSSSIFIERSNCVISDCKLMGSYSHNYSGGGIQADSSKVAFTGSNIVTNNSVLLGNGGGLSLTSSNVHVSGNLTVSRNLAGSIGGGIFVENCRFTVTNSSLLVFENNKANTGGCLSISNSHCVFNGKVEFSGNNADEYGGGILVWYNSHCSFNGNADFSNNSADYGGGMLVLHNANCTFNGLVEFSGNSAGIGGGGMAVWDNSCCIFNKRVEFTDNYAAEYSGGMLVWDNSHCTFNGQTEFFDNTADVNGGGIAVWNNSNCTFNEHAEFTDNSATGAGGMAVWDHSTCIFNENVEFSGNSVGFGGGGMAIWDNAYCTFRERVGFSENRAADYGGGMLVWDNSHFTFYGQVEFSGNSAYYGGGILVWGNSHCAFYGRVEFFSNSANNGGGMLVLYKTHCTFNEHVEFFDNSAADEGGGMAVYEYSECIFSNRALFSGNSAGNSGGSLFAHVESNITFLSLANISTGAAGREGGGILVRDGSSLVMSGETIMKDNNASSYGGAISLDSSELRMEGGSKITSNSAQYGGAIQAISSKVHISGDHHFENNHADYGGGWALFGGSSIYFPGVGRVSYTDNSVYFCLPEELNVRFLSNHAEQYGGAIWVENTPYYSCTNDKSDQKCFIRPDPSPLTYDFFCLNSFSSYHYDFVAMNNTAIAGGNIYGGNIDSCLEDIKGSLLIKLFNESSANSISSDPYQVCLCNIDSEPDCFISDHHIEVFSGEQLQLTLVGVGQRNGTVPAVILSRTDPPRSSNNGSVTQSAPGSCEVFSYTITSDLSSVKLILYPESLCPENLLHMLTVHVNLKPCPPGFTLDSQTKSCVCDDALKDLDNSIQCDINFQTFSHQHGVWIGYDQLNETVVYHPHCPFDYCKQEQSNFNFNTTDNQCRYGRSGLICGACSEGYSLTLGGSECRECSHFFLLLFLPLALAGVVLVLFLIIFRLTVSMGTINGLIFFANIIGTNSSIFLPPESTVVLRVFIAWLNLDLGIDTCLFDGLDMYIKVWLQFVFPFYVFTLIGMIIFVSQRSSLVTKFLGNDPVAVLATLILVAYTKLLRAVLTVMSFTYIQSFGGSSITVWLYDGNVRYLSGKHIPLFVFALLILLLLIIPYTVILLFAPYLQHHSKNKALYWINDYRLQAFLNSYYAPLKDKYRSWIGLLLVLRLCLLIVFVSNSLGDPSINLLAIAAVVFFLQCWRVVSGIYYTNWLFDALELFFIMKLGLFSVATLYVINTDGHQRALADTLVGVAFIVFVAITVYHGWRQLTDSRWWRLTLKPKLQKHVHFDSKNEEGPGIQEVSDKCEEPQIPPKVLTTVIELREPVMDFC